MTKPDAPNAVDAQEPEIEDGKRAAEIAALLLHSASLDRPDAARRERSVDAAVALRAQEDSRGPRRSLIAACAIAASAGALWFLWPDAAPRHASAEAPALPATVPATDSAGMRAALAPCAGVLVAPGAAPQLDDMEDGDAALLPVEGRKGEWTVAHDGTSRTPLPSFSTFRPTRVPNGRAGSRSALHLAGGRFLKWGISISAELSARPCYDLRAYSGVQFWARGSSRVYFGVQMIDVIDVKSGGLCKEECYNEHRAAIDLTREWQRYDVRWEELKQLEPVPALAFDPARAKRISFAVFGQDTPFELWLDDIAFTAHE